MHTHTHTHMHFTLKLCYTSSTNYHTASKLYFFVMNAHVFTYRQVWKYMHHVFIHPDLIPGNKLLDKHQYFAYLKCTIEVKGFVNDLYTQQERSTEVTFLKSKESRTREQICCFKLQHYYLTQWLISSDTVG